MNKITLIGNLTHDPEVRSTSNGVTVTSFTIAVDRKFKDQSGEKSADFFRINAWRALGETCARWLSKGKKVAVVGELQARTYEDKKGTTRLSLDVQADEVEFLSAKQEKHDEPHEVDASGFTEIDTSDLPF
jgi:single-strand DNA-binding protein